MAVRWGADPIPLGGPHSAPSGRRVNVKTRGPRKRKFSVGGEPFTPEKMAEWTEMQVQRPNLAEGDGYGTHAPAAIQYVTQMVRWHEERTYDTRAKWELLNHILRGKSLSAIGVHGDIHVAELYKRLERMVPALVQAIMDHDPWFTVEGRDGLDRRRKKGITEWLRYQLQVNHFDTEVESWVRAFLVYQFAAWKVYWDYEFRDVINRYYEDEDGPDGKMALTVTAKEEKVLTFEGNRMKLVDPLTFIFDPRQTRVEDMEFVGDWCEMSEVAIRRYAEQGVFAQGAVDELLKGEGQNAPQSEVDYQRDLRSLTSTFDQDRQRRSKHQPKTYRVVELWAQYRPTDSDEIQSYKIVVANGTHLLELRRNPHDGGHVPYAIARSAKEPFDFLNVGVFDHAIPLQVEVDNHRRLGMQAHLNAVAPPVFVPMDVESDMPLYLWQIEPGRIYRSNNPPAPLKLPTTLGEVVGMEDLMRRDMDEITGSPPSFDQDTGALATTINERKVEGNRRLRGLVFRFADGLVDAMQIMLANTRQYVTPQKAMRVLNGDFMALKLREPITPLTFKDPVDIRIRGLSGLAQHGLRATSMVQWMTQVAPLLPQAIQAGNLSVEELLYTTYEGVVGERLDDTVLRRPRARDQMLSPTVENAIFEQGGYPEVHPDDPDAAHVEAHIKALEAGRFTQEEASRVLEHVMEHQQAVQSKQARRQAMQQEPAPVFPPGATLTPRASDAKGRYDQPADLMAQANPGSVPGETPGPANASRMAAMDRQQPVTQEMNEV